jgi:choline dehydrogenase-like flavoprotein
MWDLPGCFVADASVFPSAIGVNPQITIFAMATRIAWRLAEQLPTLKQAA